MTDMNNTEPTKCSMTTKANKPCSRKATASILVDGVVRSVCTNHTAGHAIFRGKKEER